MPAIKVILYRDHDGTVPIQKWIDELRDPKAGLTCTAMMIRLQQLGPELRRPNADILRDGIHELRGRERKVQLRILYFFVGRDAVISHGFVKRGGKVPDKEIDLAIARLEEFLRNPEIHSFEGEVS